MWKTILRQMWRQRKLNLWVMAGLVLITIVIWFIIDPLFVLCYNRWIVPDGFDVRNLYVLSLRQFPKQSKYYIENEKDSNLIIEDFYRILNSLKQQPEIESYTVIDEAAYPFSDRFYFVDVSRHQNDSSGIPVQSINHYNEGNYFQTFRIHSEKNEELLPQNGANTFYISRNIVSYLGETDNGIYKELFDVDGESYKIAGIVNDIKISTYELPGALIYRSVGKVENRNINEGRVEIVYRVKGGALKGIAFADYRRKMEKLLRSNNLYTTVKPFSKIRQEYELTYGITNQLRIRTFLIFFFLLNMILGVIGTFWFRCRSRQEEIGLRMAVGCTRYKIASWFFLEGFILSTFAVIMGTLIIVQWIWYEGMYIIQNRHMFFVGTGYLTDNVILHFLCVFSITYFLILLTVASGTFFPAWIATKVNPAEALQVE